MLDVPFAAVCHKETAADLSEAGRIQTCSLLTRACGARCQDGQPFGAAASGKHGLILSVVLSKSIS